MGLERKAGGNIRREACSEDLPAFACVVRVHPMVIDKCTSIGTLDFKNAGCRIISPKIRDLDLNPA